MAEQNSSLTRLTISYYDETATPDTVFAGFREFVLAERKFGSGAIQAQNMDALGFAAYLAARRSGLVAEGISYDAWLENVAMIAGDDENPGESPAPPA